MMLFGGMPKGHGLGGWTFLNGMIGHMSNGDNPYGWRFLDLVFGALVVMLLYCFAKRVTGSTLFATTTALLLTFDGMHFVQSRTVHLKASSSSSRRSRSTRSIVSGSARRSANAGTSPAVVGIRGRRGRRARDRRSIGQICRIFWAFRRCGHLGRHALRDVPRLFARALSPRAAAVRRRPPRAYVRRGLLRVARRRRNGGLRCRRRNDRRTRKDSRGAISQAKGGISSTMTIRCTSSIGATRAWPTKRLTAARSTPRTKFAPATPPRKAAHQSSG